MERNKGAVVRTFGGGSALGGQNVC